MAGGFESLGLGPELVRAVEVDLGWLLPTDVQDEAIPLILGGGDVMAAAETGSGKTAAFALPVLQLVMEFKRRQAEGPTPMEDTSGGAATSPSDWRMSGLDRDPMLSIGADGVTCQGTAPRWVGGRATIGVTGGKVYYEMTMLDSGLGRVGWSTTSANYNLGTDKHGLGFGGTGMKSHMGKFEPYGEAFTQGDVIGCYLDMDAGVVSFSKNGKTLGEAFRFEPSRQPFFPAVAIKQAQVRVNLMGPMAYPPQAPWIAVGQAPHADVHVPTFEASSPGGSGGRASKGDAKGEKGCAALAIILEPARDLAEQVYNCICDYKRYADGVSAALVVGGTDHGEVIAGLRRGADIVVATPGKLMDLIKRGLLLVDRVRFFILDEADRLLETGNSDDIMTVFHRLPKGGLGDQRLQVCFFSATLHSPEITQLADKICQHPTWVDLKGKDSVPESVHHVVVEVDLEKYKSALRDERKQKVNTDDVHLPNPRDAKESCSEMIKKLKPLVLVELIEKYKMQQCMIFCRTNLDCDLLEQFLVELGGGQRFRGKTEKGKESLYSCCVLAGMRSQQERRANLQAFKDGDVRFLICTDVAARGIDIQALPYVINMTLPDVVENYIHRVGRVGRADCIGLAISIVAAPGCTEKVWYHTCANRGKGCTNRSLKDNGGCTIWYDEADILRQVEARLQVEKIPRLSPPDFELPSEIKGQLGEGKYGQSVSSSPLDATIAKHIELLQPAVVELAELEFRAQTAWLNLRQRYRGGTGGAAAGT